MTLTLIGTPLGNLNDISISFLKTVSQLEILAVEDTRSSAKLLQALQIRFPAYRLWPKKLISFYREKERSATETIVSCLREGNNVGLMSEAGMPGVSDPGSYLVSRVRSENLTIDVVPGPSALTTVLSLSGFEANLAIFLGFFPKAAHKTMSLMESVMKLPDTKSVNWVFFESPFRIQKTGKLLFEHFPQGHLFLGRELTKRHQELLWLESASFTSQTLIAKGEYSGVFHLKMI